MRTFLPSLFRKVGALVVFGHALASGRGTLCAESDASSPAVFVISVPDQQLAVIHGDRISATFPVSTSKFGLGDAFGSYKTPLGLLQICEKIGGHLPLGAVIKKRCATGEIIFPNASGRDAVVSRILWLEGRESGNSHSYHRGIYIHGTPEESRIGQPVSWGCIRMRSRDIVQLFDLADKGTVVEIVNQSLAAGSFKYLASGGSNGSDPSAPQPFYRLLLVANTAEIPSSFLDIRWSAGISGWGSSGLHFRAPRAAPALTGITTLARP